VLLWLEQRDMLSESPREMKCVSQINILRRLYYLQKRESSCGVRMSRFFAESFVIFSPNRILKPSLAGLVRQLPVSGYFTPKIQSSGFLASIGPMARITNRMATWANGQLLSH
jgi:hypothetical protein